LHPDRGIVKQPCQPRPVEHLLKVADGEDTRGFLALAAFRSTHGETLRRKDAPHPFGARFDGP
jgi:hypothetical protein